MKLTTPFDLTEGKGNLYFMSDLHYDHENVLHLSDRNFSDISEMNSYILETLSSTLRPEDTVFDLGDLAWKINTQDLKGIIDACNGATFYKILGNHDNYNLYHNPSAREVQNLFAGIYDFLEISVKAEDSSLHQVTLFHYPIEDYPGMYRGALHLYGHTHGHLDDIHKESPKLMVDVGFDSFLSKRTGSFLIPFSEILSWFYEKTGGQEFREWAKEKLG